MDLNDMLKYYNRDFYNLLIELPQCINFVDDPYKVLLYLVENKYYRTPKRAFKLLKNKTNEICKLMLEFNGNLLKYIDDDIKTEELCIIAVKSKGTAIKYIASDKITIPILLYALDNNIEVFISIKDKIPIELNLNIISKYPDLIKHFENPSLLLQKTAILSNPKVIKFIKNKSIEIIKYAYNIDHSILKYIDNIPNDLYENSLDKPSCLKYIKNISDKKLKTIIVRDKNYKKYIAKSSYRSLYR